MNIQMKSKDDYRPILIDLGCGNKKYQSSVYKVIGIDLSDDSDADLYISAFDLPLEDESVDYAYSRHFIEHFDIENLEKLFSGIFRVLSQGSTFEIIVPHVSCISAFQDPTHKSYFTRNTFYKLQYLGFKVTETRFHWFRKPYKGRFPIVVKFVDYMLNRFLFLERFSPCIGGIYEIRCLMEKNNSMLDKSFTPGKNLNY
tara:strand:- start:5012 stop:5611 length:600 start_codon:yes stop_codon:yes gene_type:complete